MQKIVHVVGTGTIGEPLIGLFADFKKYLGIDEITFHKRTPMTTERAKVNHLLSRGARLAADPRVEKETMHVRFLRINSSSLDVEVFAYLLLPDSETFLAVQEELLIMLLEVVEKAGTRLALPSQMTYVAGESTHPLAARALGLPPAR